MPPGLWTFPILVWDNLGYIFGKQSVFPAFFEARLKMRVPDTGKFGIYLSFLFWSFGQKGVPDMGKYLSTSWLEMPFFPCANSSSSTGRVPVMETSDRPLCFSASFFPHSCSSSSTGRVPARVLQCPSGKEKQLLDHEGPKKVITRNQTPKEISVTNQPPESHRIFLDKIPYSSIRAAFMVCTGSIKILRQTIDGETAIS